MAQIENLLYDFIRDNEIATENEIELVTNINGYSEETLNDIIHCRTEYHDVPQLYACEPENYYFSEELLEAYGLTEDEAARDGATPLYRRIKRLPWNASIRLQTNRPTTAIL